MDYEGGVLYTNSEGSGTAVAQAEENVIDPRVSYMLIDILRDNKARTPAFGSHSGLIISGHPESGGR